RRASPTGRARTRRRWISPGSPSNVPGARRRWTPGWAAPSRSSPTCWRCSRGPRCSSPAWRIPSPGRTASTSRSTSASSRRSASPRPCCCAAPVLWTVEGHEPPVAALRLSGRRRLLEHSGVPAGYFFVWRGLIVVAAVLLIAVSTVLTGRSRDGAAGAVVGVLLGYLGILLVALFRGVL